MKKVLLLFVILIVVFGVTINADVRRGDFYPEYTCQKQGLFPHPEYTDCSGFILCDNNLKATSQECQHEMYFWPSQNGCFNYYNCSTDSSIYGANPCEGFNGEIINKLSNNCSSYFNCREDVTPNGDFSYTHPLQYGKVEQCNRGTTFRQHHPSYCTSESICVDYECVEEGHFSNPYANDCSSFILCSKYSDSRSNGTFLYPALITCPQNTSFSPYSKKCDAYYTCGGKDLWKGKYPCSNNDGIVAGLRELNVPNPLEKKCATYLSCYTEYQYIKVGVIEKKVCPPKTFYSPEHRRCLDNYVCNQIKPCSKDPCASGVGKFVDYKSGGCETFIECRNDATASGIYQPSYEIRHCPPGTLFSPKVALCDPKYVCPRFPVNYCYPSGK